METPLDPGTVVELLRGVVDPELGADIVTLGMVGEVTCDGGVVDVPVGLTTSGCPLRAQIRDDVVRRVSSLPGVVRVRVRFSELDAQARSLLMARARLNAQRAEGETRVPTTARVLAVASGKGGVGKSSVSAHLAGALARRGFRVGLADADVWGHSIPHLLGVQGRLAAETRDTDAVIMPMTLACGEGELKVVSTGLVLDEPGSALMWRGPVLARAVQHFLEDVDWDGVDYLVVDLPPGTGDVQMALARLVPRTDVLVVTTPDPGASQVAALAADMARRSFLRVAGVVENMAWLACPHGERVHLFGEPAGERFAAEVGAPLLASLPVERSLTEPGAALTDGDGQRWFDELASRIVEEVAPPVDLATCTSRLLRSLEAAARDALPTGDGTASAH